MVLTCTKHKLLTICIRNTRKVRVGDDFELKKGLKLVFFNGICRVPKEDEKEVLEFMKKRVDLFKENGIKVVTDESKSDEPKDKKKKK